MAAQVRPEGTFQEVEKWIALSGKKSWGKFWGFLGQRFGAGSWEMTCQKNAGFVESLFGLNQKS
jgi:hypothetical protein